MTVRCFLAMAACWSCLGCRTADSLQREGSASSAHGLPAADVRARSINHGRVELIRMENGVCQDAKRPDELWRLLDRPDDFSKYLVDEINAFLSPAQGK